MGIGQLFKTWEVPPIVWIIGLIIIGIPMVIWALRTKYKR